MVTKFKIDKKLVPWAIDWLVSNVGPVVRITEYTVDGVSWQLDDYGRSKTVWVEINDDKDATIFALSLP